VALYARNPDELREASTKDEHFGACEPGPLHCRRLLSCLVLRLCRGHRSSRNYELFVRAHKTVSLVRIRTSTNLATRSEHQAL